MGVGCILSPATCLAGPIAHATFSDLFGALTSWMVDSVGWMLRASGAALASASEPATVLASAQGLYRTLEALAPALMILGLTVATLQAVRHGDAGSLWRVYFGVLPASVAGIVLAPHVAALVLRAVNELTGTAAASVQARTGELAARVSSLVGTVPGFGLFVLAGALVIGSWLLWCELIVRVVVLTVLLVLVPLVAGLAVLPALRRAPWRLGETFIAVALAKFLVVLALVLGLDELTGTSATQVVVGVVTLALAAGAPFVLLRLVPVLEQSALQHAEGVRQRLASSSRRGIGQASRVLGAMSPESAMAAPESPEDLGLPLLEGDGELELPSQEGPPPKAPVGEGRLRHGHVAYTRDHLGPVVTWHWDD